MRTRILAERLITCDERRTHDENELGLIEDGAVVFEGDKIVFVGEAKDAPEASDERMLFAELVTPGLVDSHTHSAFAGSRHHEYALKMAGKGYEEIAKIGGGIVASMRSVRDASAAELRDLLEARLRRMASLGVTTVEVKSGYGLDLENELKQLGAISQAAVDPTLPHLVPTYLGLHALPPEAHGDRAGYAARVATSDLLEVAHSGLARFVDAYVDRNAFSVEDARPFLEKARELGLGVRLHAGQFADVGGVALGQSVGASSLDHLENLSDAALATLGASGMFATLLPVASFTLNQAPPRIAEMRRAGCRFVVASDANPGTAPTESLPLALAFAVRTYGLTTEEALLGATRNAALSLGLPQRGALRVGFSADLVLWDLPHEHSLMCPWGSSRALSVYRDGHLIAGGSP